MPQHDGIHMGHGQMVDIVAHGPDLWELVFSQDGIAGYQAPPISDIKVEAIDSDGKIHPLAIAAGSPSSVFAAGHVAGAYRARVMVMHGDHFHTREALLPGRTTAPGVAGSSGGSLVRFQTTQVEAKLIAPDAFELRFSTAQGAPMTTPAPENVVMQAIGPKAEDYQIRNLATRAGDQPATLIATGKIKDATYLRLTLKTAGDAEVRSVPVVR